MQITKPIELECGIRAISLPKIRTKKRKKAKHATVEQQSDAYRSNPYTCRTTRLV